MPQLQQAVQGPIQEEVYLPVRNINYNWQILTERATENNRQRKKKLVSL